MMRFQLTRCLAHVMCMLHELISQHADTATHLDPIQAMWNIDYFSLEIDAVQGDVRHPTYIDQSVRGAQYCAQAAITVYLCYFG